MSEIQRLRELHRDAFDYDTENLFREYQGAFTALLDIAEAAEYADNLLRIDIDVTLARDQEPADTIVHARARLREALNRLERST